MELESPVDQAIVNAVIDTVEELRDTLMVPNPLTRGKTSSGNLAYNALRYDIRDGAIEVYVNESIAPYMPYTNEPWLSPRWNGKKNPNEEWWNRFANEVILRVAIKLKGDIK